MTLTETILIAVILVLAGILGFILYALWYERKKFEQRRKIRKDARWQTVFDRTDLRSQEVSRHV